LDAAWDKKCDLAESPAILVEVPPRHASDGGSGRRATVRALLESPLIEYIDLTTAVANRATDLTGQFPKVTNLDAIHLATAIFGGCELFVTMNTDEYPMGETVGGVLIVTPSEACERLADVLDPPTSEPAPDDEAGEQPTLFVGVEDVRT